ncbi:hypothetical protein ACQR1W_10585 [Bradyrhizobium sp. HKCCYLS1011]|uniref:hypothetical protein n=1 Tax=Bradyrhizobium sp. HKCCYLS1011 TaxID=3420733 RepID=UPI003EBA7F7D
MLRFKVLVAIALAATAAVAGKIELSSAARPCIAVGTDAVEIGSAPFHPDLHVDVTDDPVLAPVRVALAESAETADLVIANEGQVADDKGCGVTAATQFFAMARDPAQDAPRVYLAPEGPTGDRIFVRSSRFTVQQAAVLIIGAHGTSAYLTNALL